MEVEKTIPLPGDGKQTTVWDIASSSSGEVGLILFSSHPKNRGLFFYDGGRGELLSSYTPSRARPLHLAFSKNGRSRFVVEERGEGVYALSLDSWAKPLAELPIPCAQKILPLSEHVVAMRFQSQLSDALACGELLDFRTMTVTSFPLGEGIREGEVLSALSFKEGILLAVAGRGRAKLLHLTFSPLLSSEFLSCDDPPTGLWESPKGVLFVGFLFHKKLQLVSPDGSLLFEVKLPQGPSRLFFSSERSRCFVLPHFEKELFCLDAENGKLLFSHPLSHPPLTLLPRAGKLTILSLDREHWALRLKEFPI